MSTDLRPAYYALPEGSWRDHVTLFHIPYTVWHLSYVVLGAATAPALHLDRLAWVALAFFLAVGLGAHALDEFRGRALRTNLSDGWLLTIATCSLAGALSIGIFASMTISYWTLLFVAFGVLIVPAYNLELWRGRFHSGHVVRPRMGPRFPALAGYWATAEQLRAEAFVVAGACFVLSLVQRALSRQARELRRSARIASGPRRIPRRGASRPSPFPIYWPYLRRPCGFWASQLRCSP